MYIYMHLQGGLAALRAAQGRRCVCGRGGVCDDAVELTEVLAHLHVRAVSVAPRRGVVVERARDDPHRRAHAA